MHAWPHLAKTRLSVQLLFLSENLLTFGASPSKENWPLQLQGWGRRLKSIALAAFARAQEENISWQLALTSVR